jgi:hypothetical protein
MLQQHLWALQVLPALLAQAASQIVGTLRLLVYILLRNPLLRTTKKKVVDTIGDKKEQKIRAEIAEDELAKHPMEAKSIIVSGLGDTLCFDQYTGAIF